MAAFLTSAQTLKDFEPESFVLDKFIEKLAQLDPNTGLGPLSKKKDVPFDSTVLLGSFKESLTVLQDMNDKIQKRVERLEFTCVKQERDHLGRVRELEPMFQDAFNEFQVLEDRITYVARKVVHLGDQLESTNTHRQRDVDAQRLMEIMSDFHLKSKPSRPEFTDPTRLTEAADLINKLNMLATELPKSEEYHSMRQNIAERYAQIETQLVEKFCEALNTSDGKRMKIYANTLQNFHKGSEKCVMNYISHHIAGLSQSGGHLTEEVFRNMETRSAKVYKQTAEVFDDPEDIMIKYIHQATEKYLFDHVNKELTEASNQDVEKYLCKLYQLHIRAMLLRESLSKLSSQFDPVFLTKSIRATLFSEHLSGYAESEVKHLETKCKNKVIDFNNKVGIQRKANSVIRVSNALVDMETQSRPEESFISEDVCTMVLTESKSAMKRCQELLADRELSHASRDIFFTVLNVLCGDHFTVALDLAIDVKGGPVGLLFHVIGCINKNIHLVEKQYRELILPSIHYAPVAAACNEKKREYMSKLETRIEAAIEKSVGNIISTLSSLLSSQKKTDYKPEEPGIPETTPTCRKVIGHIGECAKVLKMSFDGKNLDVILLEFGVRIHRVLYEHILTFTVNSIGAMFLICDMNEYRKSIKEFGNTYLNEIFDNLQTLCNLFIVMPENLKQVCTEEPYISFDRNVIMRMIQLRYDYRSAKIGKIFS